MDDSRVLPFAARTGRGGNEPPEGGDEEDVAQGNAFATARGLRASPTLKFLRSNGTLRFAMPYSFHPIVWGQSPGLVLLEYPGFFTVALGGKELTHLENRLCDYRVTWIREQTDAQAELLPAAVTRIEIIHAYPSRTEEPTELPPTPSPA